MQKVKVADVSIKKGTNDKGEWINTQITGEDGAKFGTFHKSAASLEKGDLIELEPIVKGRNVNFENWNMLEKGTGSPGSNGKEGVYRRDTEGIEFEYKLKARLQEIERASIEAQVAFKGIMTMAAAAIAASTLPQTESLVASNEVFSGSLALALQWAEKKLSDDFDAIPTPITPSEESIEDKPAPDTFPNVGALLKWCADNGVSRPKFLELVGVKEADLPRVNIPDAVQIIREYIESADPDKLSE